DGAHEPAPPGALLPPVQRASDPALHRRLVVGVAAALGATLLVLLGFLGSSIATGRALASFGPDELVVEVTGLQWWWRVTYPSEPASGTVETANEIHVPVGRVVRLDLSAGDVIHSFWVPRLHGKRDLIPGRATQIRLRADAPGVYEGQCAEFCGHQHANMNLVVVAEPPAEFERWLAAQRALAQAPATPDEQRGQQVFATRGCLLCHAIRGTDANGRTGPDLTHLASRRGIAANARPNATGHLAAWILDPQGTKPGARMPAIPMTGDELQPLLAYLRSLR
ncbi:MAG: cytochrome c oxidase subunit II, partial [Proteobacteria bacterium]